MTGWRDTLQQFVRQEATPPHKFGHQPRLYRLTQEIAAKSEPPLIYDDDVVFAAVYLHDLGVFLGHRPVNEAELVRWDSARYAVEQTPGWLRQFGFPSEKIVAVAACIAEHQPKDVPSSLEATLIRDADILEQLGAIAVLRTAAKLGSDTRFIFFSDAERSLRSALDLLPHQLRLPASKELAVSRVAALKTFLTSLSMEAAEDLG